MRETIFNQVHSPHFLIVHNSARELKTCNQERLINFLYSTRFVHFNLILNIFLTLFSQITVRNYEEPKIKAIEIAALLQEKYAFLTGESKSPNFL